MAAKEHLANVDAPREAALEDKKLNWVTPEVAEYDVSRLTEGPFGGAGVDTGIYS